MDIHSRRLRYFVVVAEELHFTRAAARLLMSQQSLSRQIQDLEADVGAQLLHRTRHSVALTPSGRAFLRRAVVVLDQLDSAVTEARARAPHPAGRLRVGFGMSAAAELTPLIFQEFARAHPGVYVDLREYALVDQTAGLANGWADVAIVRPPISDPSIEWETLFTEPRVLTVPTDHPLAHRSHVLVEDILDVPLTIGRSTDLCYRSFWGLEEYRSSAAKLVVRASTTNSEEIELIAAGFACTVNPAAVMRYLPHAGVRHLPILDVPGSAVAVAWRRDRESPAATAFQTIASEVARRERDVVARIERPF